MQSDDKSTVWRFTYSQLEYNKTVLIRTLHIFLDFNFFLVK